MNGAEYRTKHDTFMKIVLHDVDSAPDGRILGPTWFEAFHKDGRIFTFGGIGSGDLGSRFEGKWAVFPTRARFPRLHRIEKRRSRFFLPCCWFDTDGD
jgi:hypothetical protein